MTTLLASPYQPTINTWFILRPFDNKQFGTLLSMCQNNACNNNNLYKKKLFSDEKKPLPRAWGLAYV